MPKKVAWFKDCAIIIWTGMIDLKEERDYFVEQDSLLLYPQAIKKIFDSTSQQGPRVPIFLILQSLTSPHLTVQRGCSWSMVVFLLMVTQGPRPGNDTHHLYSHLSGKNLSLAASGCKRGWKMETMVGQLKLSMKQLQLHTVEEEAQVFGGQLVISFVKVSSSSPFFGWGN